MLWLTPSEGLRRIQEAYARERSGSTIMELGVAYLWLYQYQHAWEHFCEAIEKSPYTGDGFYGMAGTAKWCLGESNEAISQWRAGLGAKYARASGLGVRMPLLLFFASVMKPRLVDQDFAKKLLSEKTTDPRIKNWPGPIAQLVSGQINEDEFQDLVPATEPQHTQGCLWLAGFYRSLISLQQGAGSDFRASMRKLTDTSQPEWQDEDVLLTRIWSEEFFLARFLAETKDY